MKFLHTAFSMFIVFGMTIMTIPTLAGTSSCTNRFEYRNLLKDVVPQWNNCSYILETFQTCTEQVVVSYRHMPPYVDKVNDTYVHGLLPDILRIIYNSCCMGCTELIFIEAPNQLSMLHQSNFSIGIPFESAVNSKMISGRDYTSFLVSHHTVFLAEEKRNLAVELTKELFFSVLNTWPLLVIAIVMAVIAGCIVWVLDMWFNKSDFPDMFPRGPFEGFWWAFVSMTTVGYGDHAPKSLTAKLFAVAWILFGITIFSMYTAALTTALNASVNDLTKPKMTGRQVGVLETTSLGKAAAVNEDAIVVPFHNTDELIKALSNDEIEAIALDELLAKYLLEHFHKIVSNLAIHHGVTIEGNSFGVITTNKETTEMLRSFFETNEDNRETIMHEVIQNNYKKLSLLKENIADTSKFYSTSSPMFNVALITLLVIGVFTVLLGVSCRWLVKKHGNQLSRTLTPRLSKKVKPNLNLEQSTEKRGAVISLDKLLKDLDELKMKLEHMRNPLHDSNGQVDL